MIWTIPRLNAWLAHGRWLCWVVGLLVISCTHGRADARPGYSANCSSCHGSAGFGNTVPDALIDIVAPRQSTIPPGAFGDPDRGEGPLATYAATAGGTFELAVQIKDPSTYNPTFLPTKWALTLQDIFHTDPDYQFGDPDPLQWRDGQLLLEGALAPTGAGPDPAPIPANSAEWWLYASQNRQFYASTSDAGHAWNGPLLINVTVSVPASVLPGWYDLEVSAAGWDFPLSFAFYDDEHFYLNVVPEPGGIASWLLLLGVSVCRSLACRQRGCRQRGCRLPSRTPRRSPR